MEWIYTLAPGEVQRLRQGLSGCRRPLRDRCSCLAHASLRSSSERLGPSARIAVDLVHGVPVLTSGA